MPATRGKSLLPGCRKPTARCFDIGSWMALRGVAHGPGHAEFDPLPQHVNLIAVELALGGHFQRAVTDGFDQQAFLRLAGDRGRTTVAAGENRLARREPQSPFDLFDRRSVTLVAVFGQKWPHALFE